MSKLTQIAAILFICLVAVALGIVVIALGAIIGKVAYLVALAAWNLIQ